MSNKKVCKNSPDDLLKAPVEIRLAKAKDLDSPPEVLRLLAEDSFWYVRDFVASNKNTPIDCLNVLVNDSDFRVRNEAAKNIFEQSFTTNHKVSLNDIILASQAISSYREAETSSTANLSHTINEIDK